MPILQIVCNHFAGAFSRCFIKTLKYSDVMLSQTKPIMQKLMYFLTNLHRHTLKSKRFAHIVQ